VDEKRRNYLGYAIWRESWECHTKCRSGSPGGGDRVGDREIHSDVRTAVKSDARMLPWKTEIEDCRQTGECQQTPNTSLKDWIFHYILVYSNSGRCISTRQICSAESPKERSRLGGNWLFPTKSISLLRFSQLCQLDLSTRIPPVARNCYFTTISLSIAM